MKKTTSFQKRLKQMKKAKTIADSIRRNHKRILKTVRLLGKLKITKT
ncbi:MAG TPA: hypothetical protein H9913_09975 [Candidatus Blautia stercoripullorum]|uniref:Uncharacterized protein n=1 Tax=Candidatus Blautia stercoripullorum TaxID=2838502 RepID=A0A9D2RC15_9FIRM|nr:hypothetical protein [Candidatus Blautia stercoripullorum]